MHRILAVALAVLGVSVVGAEARGSELDHAKMASVRYHLDFDHVDIVDVVRTLARWTGRNFILPDSIHGRITIIGASDVTADEAYDAFIAALDINGLTVAKTGAFYRIIQKKDAPRSCIPLDLRG